jgi:hypothetical protein
MSGVAALVAEAHKKNSSQTQAQAGGRRLNGRVKPPPGAGENAAETKLLAGSMAAI